MSSKNSQSNSSAEESINEYPIHSCNHLISTSLKDLSEEYENLSPKQVDSNDLNKKIAKIDGLVKSKNSCATD